MTTASEIYRKRWNDRYRQTAFAYGKTPNVFFSEQLATLPPGKLLLPAEGEGRNGIYAAAQGWEVTAFDISEEGRNKALQLAAENSVSLHYLVGELECLSLAPASFDAIGLIYAHVEGARKERFHHLLQTYLRPGGVVLLEAFGKAHLPYVEKNPAVGGPKDLDMLFSAQEIRAYFADYEILLLEEKEIQLAEGLFHNGKGSVVRFVGRKPR